MDAGSRPARGTPGEGNVVRQSGSHSARQPDRHRPPGHLTMLEVTKVCNVCGSPKPISQFQFRNKAKGARRGYCIACKKRYDTSWYARNQHVTKARNKHYNIQCTAIVRRLKEQTPCADCGLFYPYYVMDFDHRDPSTKKFGIAVERLRHIPTQRLLAEIAKCDVVCANCHRVRTHVGGHWALPHRKNRAVELSVGP